LNIFVPKLIGFGFSRVLVQGSFLLPLWPAEADKRYGPAPSPGIHPYGDTHPVIGKYS
jgi:phosphatidylinositol-4-phosphate 3-kinase